MGGEPTALDRTRLEQVYDGPDGRVFSVRDALPRAYVVGSCVEAEDSRSALARFQAEDFDPRSAVILERDQLEDADLACAAGEGSMDAHARIVDERINGLTVELDAPSAGFLVLNDTWDPGWRASVDGRDAPVLVASSVFRAVPVEAGRHTIDLRYRPRSYELGLWISVATVALMLGAFALLALRRRRPHERADPREDESGPDDEQGERGEDQGRVERG
jgi:hypothetical protein